MDPTAIRPPTPPPFVPPVGELAHEAGPRAIEIAAMLDDSIVGVRHLSDPRSGKITRKTVGLFVAGAALLGVALIAFVHGVAVARANERARAAWIEADRPIDEFRPARLSPAIDGIALSGVLCGLTAIFWGLSRLADERRPSSFRIGTSGEVELPIATLGLESFALVAPAADGGADLADFVFRRPPAATGERLFAGEVTKLDDLPPETPIRPGERFRVETGPATLLISSVPRPSRARTSVFAALEGTALAFLAGSAMAHGALLALLYSIPPDQKGLVSRELDEHARLVKIATKPTEVPVLEPVPSGPEEDGAGSEGLGNAAKGPEGEMGKKDGPAEEKKFKLEKTSEDPQLASREVVAAATHAGILGFYRRERGGAFGTVINSADFSSGLDDATVYGGLIGPEHGDSDGGFGLGVNGAGPGGIGTGLNSIGLGPGPLGRIGPGRGAKSGAGWCMGCSGTRVGGARRAGGPPRVSIGSVESPDLDKEIIRRYIRQKLAQFQHCYERRLIVKPDLSGTVTLQFTIAGTGQVTAAGAFGMDGDVASCSADVVRSIQFPRTPSGGVVNVSRYPLTFHAAE